MSEQEKKALTPEEFVARKGDVAPDRKGSPCADPEATGSRRAPYRVQTHALDTTTDSTVATRRT